MFSLKTKTTGFFWVVFTLLSSNIFVFRTILGPFVFGAVIGYILHPVVTWFARFKISRTITSLVFMATFTFLLLLFLFYFAPFLEERLKYILMRLPDLHESLKALTQPFLAVDPSIYSELTAVFPTHETLHEMAHALSHWVMHFFLGVAQSAKSVEVLAFYIVVSPLVAFDCLRDWPALTRFFKTTLPALLEEGLTVFWSDLDAIMKRCLRQHALLCGVLAVYYWVMLTLFDVPYATTLAFLTAILLLIPNLGVPIAFVLVLSIALSYKPHFVMALHIVGIYGVGVLLRHFVLRKRFLKEGIGLHPLWIFFTIFAGTFLMGPLGAFFAIPLAGLSYALLKWLILSYTRMKDTQKRDLNSRSLSSSGSEHKS